MKLYPIILCVKLTLRQILLQVKNKSFQILKNQNPESRGKGAPWYVLVWVHFDCSPFFPCHVTKQLDIFLKTIYFQLKSESYGLKILNELENIYLKGKIYSRSNYFFPLPRYYANHLL